MLNNLTWIAFGNTPSLTKSFEEVQLPLRRGGETLAGLRAPDTKFTLNPGGPLVQKRDYSM